MKLNLNPTAVDKVVLTLGSVGLAVAPFLTGTVGAIVGAVSAALLGISGVRPHSVGAAPRR